MTLPRRLIDAFISACGAHPLAAAAVTLALVVRLASWVITDRVWEDALITLTHVRNVREGIGLTHHAGEGLVHGFTSALSVLIPLAGEAVVPESGLTMMRLASLVSGAAAVLAGYLIARRLNLATWATAFVLVYLAVNQNQVFFGMAGMETQVATALLLAGAVAVMGRHERLAGLLAGLCVLARPDLVLWAGLVLIWAGRRGARSLARVAVPAVAVIAPWVIFTYFYYGSPVPQTIVAKNLVYNTLPESIAPAIAWLEWLSERVPLALGAVLRTFMPFYEDGNVVGAPVEAGALAVIGIAMVGLAILGVVRSAGSADWWPALVYSAGFLLYWVALLPLGYFGWYQPPFMAICAVLVGVGLDRLRTFSRFAPAVVSTALTLAVAVHLPFSIPLDAQVQREVEYGIRRTAGRHLAEAVAPGDAVVAEAAGYFGYYGRVTLWDFPGLTSPTALAAVRAMPRSERGVTALVDALRAPWVVLRPLEWRHLQRQYPDAARCYELERTFGVEGDLVVELNGLARWNQDGSFMVMHRRESCRAPVGLSTVSPP